MAKGICEVCGEKTRPTNKRYCGEKCMFEFVKKLDNTCWEWKGALTAYGYGQVHNKGKVRLMHILAYEKFRGPRKGLCVLHTCDNRKCINPFHLYLGTKGQNSLDKIVRGRANSPFGEKSAKAKLKENQVYELRKLFDEGLSVRKLAKIFGISDQSCWMIGKRLNWKQLPERIS